MSERFVVVSLNLKFVGLDLFEPELTVLGFERQIKDKAFDSGARVLHFDVE